MKNVKVKSKQNEREITITIYANGEEADKIVRYHNTCMICKETTVNDEDFGAEYICPLCVEWLNEKLGVSKKDKIFLSSDIVEDDKGNVIGTTSFATNEAGEIVCKSFHPLGKIPTENNSHKKVKKSVEAEIARNIRKKGKTKGNRRYKNRNYSTKFQVLDVVNYQNLLGIPNIPEKTLNLIVSFVIEGRNTANKIHKIMKNYALETIYIYLTRMAKVGMLYNSGENKAVGKGRYNQIFKVMRTLNYTQVDEIVK